MAQTKEQAKAWRLANPDKLAVYSERSYEKNRQAQIARSRAYRLANPEKIAAKRKETWVLKEKHRYREYTLLKKYGITSVEISDMLVLQHGLCAICSTSDPRSKDGTFVVDHCHATGKVRALLCGPCNTGLGMYKDQPAVLRAAADYLEKHSG